MNKIEKIKAEIERRKKRNKEEYGGDGLFEVQDNLNKLLSFIDSLDETSGDLEAEIKQAIDRLEGCAIKDDGKITSHLVPIDALKDFARHFANWQKEQETVEWSEEDKDKLYQVMATLLADKTVALRETPHCKALHEAYDELLAWLKSLRPSCPKSSNNWKPSEEQMEALEECGECKRCIKELYEQLKRIKED